MTTPCLRVSAMKNCGVVQAGSGQGVAPVNVDRPLQLDDPAFSDDFRRGVRDIVRKPLRRRVEQANKQIKAAAKELGLKDSKGLLVIANNQHSALHPAGAMDLIFSILNNTDFSGINGFVYMTLNMVGRHPAVPGDVIVWSPGVREPSIEPLDESFMAKLGAAWFAHLKTMPEHADRLVQDREPIHMLPIRNEEKRPISKNVVWDQKALELATARRAGYSGRDAGT